MKRIQNTLPTHMATRIACSALLGAALAIPATHAAADHLTYFTANFSPLNGSNVEGNAILTYDSMENTLSVTVDAFDLEQGQEHLMHIHGLLSDGAGSMALDSTTPTMANDTDGDGYIEVLEGLPTYGDILLPLMTTTAEDGTIHVEQVFDLSDDSLFFSPVSGAEYTAADLFPLHQREIVIHGKTVATGEGIGTEGAVDGTGGYKATLPVAAAEIVGSQVPEPASLALVGLAGLTCMRRRRQG